jgi:hypothetical protein
VTTGTTTNAYGDVVPNETTGSLVLSFKPYAFGSLRYRQGADMEVVPGRFRCLDPALLPTGLGVGSVMDVTWNGQAGQITVTNVIRKSLAVLDEGLGQEFLGEWRPT